MYSSPQVNHPKQLGFSLAELLISLLILAEIATFTIPKILVTQQAKSYNTNAKQVAAMVSAIFFNEYNSKGGESWIDQQDTTYDWESGLLSLLPSKINYVKYLSNNEIMTYPPGGPTVVFGGDRTCGVGGVRCYLLSNGGVLWWFSYAYAWDGQYAQLFMFDPDGTGAAESVPFFLLASRRSWITNPNGGKYPPGKIMTLKELGHISYWGFGSANPSWFSWN